MGSYPLTSCAAPGKCPARTVPEAAVPFRSAPSANRTPLATRRARAAAGPFSCRGRPRGGRHHRRGLVLLATQWGRGARFILGRGHDCDPAQPRPDPNPDPLPLAHLRGSDGRQTRDRLRGPRPAEESGRVVLEAEQLLHERRPDAIILRFAGIYGPGRLPRAREIVAGEALAVDPETWLNLIHVEDGATAVMAADERGRPEGIYNIADDRPAPRREFYAHLAPLLRSPAARFLTPPAAHHVHRRIAPDR